MKTSVFVIDGLSEEDVWVLSDTHLLPLSPAEPILARGDLGVGAINGTGLRCNRDDQPDRHANIEAWPEDKEARILLSQELAANAVLVLRPVQL
jgi:hypothetical protein